MAVVEITQNLEKEIEKQFKAESVDILLYLQSLEQNPKKGKIVATVGGIVVKELKYEGYRFFFIVDGYKLRVYSEKEFVDILLRFVRMSNKKQQQKVIDEIKEILIKIGPRGFS